MPRGLSGERMGRLQQKLRRRLTVPQRDRAPCERRKHVSSSDTELQRATVPPRRLSGERMEQVLQELRRRLSIPRRYRTGVERRQGVPSVDPTLQHAPVPRGLPRERLERVQQGVRGRHANPKGDRPDGQQRQSLPSFDTTLQHAPVPAAASTSAAATKLLSARICLWRLLQLRTFGKPGVFPAWWVCFPHIMQSLRSRFMFFVYFVRSWYITPWKS